VPAPRGLLQRQPGATLAELADGVRTRAR